MENTNRVRKGAGNNEPMKPSTIRLSKSLKKRIKATNRPAAEVIRDALNAYFGIDDQLATIGEIRRQIEEHERAHHSREAIISDIVKMGGVQALVDAVTIRQQSSDIEPDMPIVKEPIQEQVQTEDKQAGPEPDKRVLKIMALESLLKFLANDQEVTSGTVAKDTGLEARSIGRWFAEMGMERKNTRVHNIAGKYWGFANEDLAKKELERLRAELKMEADKIDEIGGDQGESSGAS
jgi:hypothetical protein